MARSIAGHIWPLGLLGLLLGLVACRPAAPPPPYPPRPALPDSNEVRDWDGAQLAAAYCTGCHLLPSPAQLPGPSWTRGVLPLMGRRLGIPQEGAIPVGAQGIDVARRMLQAEIFPARPQLSTEAWARIVAYFETYAPDSLSPRLTFPLPTSEGPLTMQPQPTPSDLYPLVCLLQWDSARQALWVGDRQGNLFLLDEAGEPLLAHRFASAPVAITPAEGDAYHVLTIGIFNPSDQERGRLYRWQPPQPGRAAHLDTLLQGLARPVTMAWADLDQDGLQDVVVGEFGYWLGRLAWYRQAGDGRFERQILRPYPGATALAIRDLNADGWPDLLVLMAQGAEGIYQYLNQGGGQFQESIRISWPAVWGANAMRLVDLDGDGEEEFVCTNGDNADGSFTLKPYHGLQIYRPRTSGELESVFSYPAYGASGVEALDLDEDGDLDLGLIAFFADFDRDPAQGFIWLENVSAGDSLAFRPHLHPEGAAGRWLVMSARPASVESPSALFLGNFAYAPTAVPDSLQRFWEQVAPKVQQVMGAFPARQ
ncbi:MAG: hypothetical protein D6722_04780 [Bacteroidetes bacterium]|nr:MAG: hypothetical protein D6722_04780 [Bacteroidota bacterium]